MKWISALELGQWADRVPARVAFPELIRDLIIASAGDISEIRFPSGDKGQVRGFDGWLEAAGAPPYVPAGLSIWEFGVSANPGTKFAKDYDTRVRDIDAVKRKDITFVFASPRTWDSPQQKLPDFVDAYRRKRDFRDVHYIDGVQLEEWLQRCGAVGARHARDILGRLPQTGARSTDEFWEEYRRRFRPPLTEDVVLCARGVEADQIVAHLLGKPGALVYVADGPDEVSAVAVAAIRKSQPDSRSFLEARTLIVDNEEAGRTLAVPDRYGFVLSPSVTKVAGLLASVGPTVSGMGFNAPGQSYSRLTRPSTREMAEALQTMELDEEAAMRLAAKSGRSLTILERHAPAAGFEPPAWVGEGAKLVPALLAGGWDSRHDGDKAVLGELAGVADYMTYEASIRGFLDRHDSPLDREAGIWKLRAPVDAFVNLSRLLGAEHLTLLASVAVKLFSAPPPNIGEERFGVSKAPYSSRLRDGVANTLLMLAALHVEVALDVGRDPEAFVRDIVAGLPGLSDDIRIILSLERQLPALMEAAPDPLLSALEHMLAGDPVTIAPLFPESGEFGGSRSRLPDLLWSLETLAWDPAYLERVSLLLARLAAADPGGRSGNRPIGSLRDIFVAWLPGTNAPLPARLAVLDAVVAQVPATGWELLVRLLPQIHDTKGPTQAPRYREAGASGRELLTRGVVHETYDAVIDRVLTMLTSDVQRWLAVLQAFPAFSPDRRAQFLDLLAGYAVQVDGEDKIALRRKARGIADRHSRFRDANWAMPDGDLERLKSIVAVLESVEPIEQARELFDERSAFGAGDYAEAERQLSQRRQRAVASLLEIDGAEALLQLVNKVRTPHLVAAAAAQGIEDVEALFGLIGQAPDTGSGQDFAISLAGALRWQRDASFDNQFLKVAEERGWSKTRVAALMLNWPELPTTWAMVESLGEEAKALFWRRREPRRFDGDRTALIELAVHFLAAGRAGTALTAIYGRENELDWPLLATILGMCVQEINAAGDRDVLDDYYVEELFKRLRERDDVPRLDLAKWEYAYFPLLEHRDHDLALFELMASDPDFYMSILKDVFVEDGTDPDTLEFSDEERRRGDAAYRVLIAFDRAPGEKEGVVDAAALDQWVDGIIAAATRERRLNIVYSYIGRALAHTSEKDGLWPQPPVAGLLERLKSPDLERGISIERRNMRGVYTKAMFEGGVQERDLAQQYRNWAERQAATCIRTRSMLIAIARSWEADAKRADEEAARDRLRFE